MPCNRSNYACIVAVVVVVTAAAVVAVVAIVVTVVTAGLLLSTPQNRDKHVAFPIRNWIIEGKSNSSRSSKDIQKTHFLDAPPKQTLH